MKVKEILRKIVVPFFMAFFPTVWYINRNLMTEQLPPRTEPTTALVAFAVGVAVVGSAIFAAIVARFSRHRAGRDHEVSYRYRVFRPDNTTMGIFFCFVTLSGLLLLVESSGLGPAWLGDVLALVLVPVVLPFLVLAPLAIQFHWAVVIGLVLCVPWMSLVATVIADGLHSISN